MEEPKVVVPNSVLKRNAEKYACKSTKQERRKKLNRFKDAAKKALGKPTIYGASYCCFECSHHKTEDQIDGHHICVICRDGNHFDKIEGDKDEAPNETR